MRALYRLWSPRSLCVATRSRRGIAFPPGTRCGKSTPARTFACSRYLAQQGNYGDFQADSRDRNDAPKSITTAECSSLIRRVRSERVSKKSEGNAAIRKPGGHAASRKPTEIAASTQHQATGFHGMRRFKPTIGITISLAEFERRVENDTATVQDAEDGLRGHREHIETLPFAERRQACVDLNAGHRILDWLLAKREDIPTDIYRHRSFSSSLMWFAIGEGIEEIAWNWVKIEIGQGNWRLANHLIASLAHAHTGWDPDGCPNAALRCFKRAVETLPRSIQGNVLVGIGSYISKTLEHTDCPPSEDALFQFYFDRTQIFDAGELGSRLEGRQFQHSLRSELRKPQLMLFHPSKPDATGFLYQLQHGPTPRRLETHAIWRAERQSSRHFFGSTLLRLSYILRLQSNYAVADWVEACVERKAPLVWRHRDSAIKQFLGDRKLDGLRRNNMDFPNFPKT